MPSGNRRSGVVAAMSVVRSVSGRVVLVALAVLSGGAPAPALPAGTAVVCPQGTLAQPVKWLVESGRRTVAEAEALSDRVSELLYGDSPEATLVVAEEAVAAWRGLERAHPGSYRWALAESRRQLAVALGEAGQAEKALGPAREAVDSLRLLAREEPDEPSSELLIALNTYANVLDDADRTAEALRISDEALLLGTRLARSGPAGVYDAMLAVVVSNRSRILFNAGLDGWAIAAAQDAVDRYLALTKKYPARYTPDLANAYDWHGILLRRAGRWQEAAIVSGREVALLRRLVAEDPRTYRSSLALALFQEDDALARLGQPEAALPLIAEATGLYRTLAREEPAENTGDLADALHNFCVRLDALGRMQEALALCDEAIVLYRQLAAEEPDTYGSDLAEAVKYRDLIAGRTSAARSAP